MSRAHVTPESVLNIKLMWGAALNVASGVKPSVKPNIRWASTLLIMWLAALLALSGCDNAQNPSSSENGAGDSPSEAIIWVDLARGDAWSIAPQERDPYAGQREDRERCTETDFGVEYGGLEVSTTYCCLLYTSPSPRD